MGERRNCSLRAISPLPTVFLKRLMLQTHKKPLTEQSQFPNNGREKRNIVEKGENAGNQQFLLFLQCFYPEKHILKF